MRVRQRRLNLVDQRGGLKDRSGARYAEAGILNDCGICTDRMDYSADPRHVVILDCGTNFAWGACTLGTAATRRAQRARLLCTRSRHGHTSRQLQAQGITESRCKGQGSMQSKPKPSPIQPQTTTWCCMRCGSLARTA